jgi:predicted nucleic acid-binding protein
MKVFLDANVLVSVLCNEYPAFTYSARVLSLADHPKFEVFTSPLCLAIGFYFSEKKNGSSLAIKKIQLLASKLGISPMDEKTVRAVSSLANILDYEDGLQYTSAKEAGCTHLVTYNTSDYWFADMEIMEPKVFLEEVALPYFK